MGILVCFDPFRYDVVNDLNSDSRILGYDNSCEWEKVVVKGWEELPEESLL